MTDMPPPPTTVLINAQSGTARRHHAVADLQQTLATRLPHATCVVLQPHDDVTDRARAACAAGAQVVAAAGGDGTINAVAQALVGTGVRLGVLPFGTLNHFARAMNVPTDLAAAVDLLAHAPARQVDVGAINDHYFVNNASVGMYPELVYLREHQGKQIAKPVRMVRAAWHLLRTGTPITLTLDAPVQRRPQAMWLLFVGNNRYDLGPLHPGQRRRLDRGQLDVIVVPARQHRWRLVLNGVRRRLRRSVLVRFAAGTLTVEPAAPGAALVAFDGEERQLDPPFVFRSVPHALWVIAPPDDTVHTP